MTHQNTQPHSRTSSTACANTKGIASAWRAGAAELAEKFMREYVNRIDVCGAYKRTDRRKRVQRPDGSAYVDKVYTWPAKEKRGGGIILNQLILRRHFEGQDGNIRGLHSTSQNSTCKWGALDIDKHEGQSCDTEANWRAARTAYDICVSYGLAGLLTDSNGDHGYHLLVPLAQPVPAERMYAFLRHLVTQLGEPGVHVETFPKQPELTTTKRFGNWLRMPGKHHTKPHWSRVWDGEKWLEGEAAVKAILALQPNAVSIFNAIEIPQPPAPAAPKPRPKPERRDGDGRLSDPEIVVEALKLLDPSMCYDEWIKVGQACHSVGSGADMLSAWIHWSQDSPKFTPGLCEEKWATFTAGGGVGIGTLVTMARKRDPKFLKPGSRPKVNGNKKQERHRGGARAPVVEPVEEIVVEDHPGVEAPPYEEPDGYGSNADNNGGSNGSNGRKNRKTTNNEGAGGDDPGAHKTHDADADDVIDQAVASKDLRVVFKAVPRMARMSSAAFAVAKQQLKNAFGKELNLNDLQRAVRDERRDQRRRDRQTRVRDTGQNLPPICITNRQMREVTDDALVAMVDANDPPSVFMRSGELVHLRTDEKRRHVLKSVGESALRGRLERSANYFTLGRDEEEIIEPPPVEVCKDILALSINEELERLGKAPLPALEAIVDSPVLRSDGSILNTSGYDAATRLYFAPTADVNGVRVPMKPTGTDLRDAVTLIEEVIGEFPFEDEASAANAKAALLSPFIRHAITGKVPLAIFDKPQPGTGGSLLAEAIETIATGREAAMWGAPETDSEWRKLITSILREGHTLVIIDNVEDVLESDSLARVITCLEWGDRILGESREIRLPARACWFVTGNNVQLGRNLARRCFQIRMNAKVSQPWRRNDFKHPNLIEWIKENRGRILAAVLTIGRAWYAAGKPLAQTPVLGSFENWSKTIGGILAHAGITGFLGNLESMHAAADEEAPQWEAFLLAWERTYGSRAIMVSEIERGIQKHQQLRESLPNELATLVEHELTRGINSEAYRIHPKFKIKLGKGLQKRADMRFGESSIYVSRAGEDSDKKVAMWRCSRGVRGVPGSATAQARAGDTTLYAGGNQGVHAHKGDQLHNSPALPVLPVKPADLSPKWLEHFNERVAVLEIDGGMEIERAEGQAFEETVSEIQNKGGE